LIKLRTYKFHNLFLVILFTLIKTRARWARHVACVEQMRNAPKSHRHHHNSDNNDFQKEQTFLIFLISLFNAVMPRCHCVRLHALICNAVRSVC